MAPKHDDCAHEAEPDKKYGRHVIQPKNRYIIGCFRQRIGQNQEIDTHREQYGDTKADSLATIGRDDKVQYYKENYHHTRQDLVQYMIQSFAPKMERIDDIRERIVAAVEIFIDSFYCHILQSPVPTLNKLFWQEK